MLLSVVINHYKVPNLLINCIDSIIKNLKSIDYEIIVVDSEAQEGTKQLLNEKYGNLHNFRYIGSKKNVGFGKSVNAGIKKSKGKYIFILNADIVTRNEKSIIELINYLEKHEQVGLIGPKLLNVDNTLQQSFFHEPGILSILARRTAFAKTKFGQKVLSYYSYKNKNLKKPFEVDWLMGSALMTKQSYIKKVGLLDERFFMYFEDVDWAKRFKQAGFKIIYYPHSVFTHYHIRASLKRGLTDIFLNKYTRVHIMSFLKYMWKWKNIRLI